MFLILMSIYIIKRSLIFIFVYILATAGRMAGPNFLRNPMGARMVSQALKTRFYLIRIFFQVSFLISQATPGTSAIVFIKSEVRPGKGVWLSEHLI